MKINSKKKEAFAEASKKGFTLIELLIVIAIIAMLSVLAINGYVEYRKSALLDLAADNIVAQINEMREKTIHGSVGSERFNAIKRELEGSDIADEIPPPDGAARCYGIYLDGDFIKTFSNAFSGRKSFVAGQWQYQGCADFEFLADDAKMELDDQVSILSVKDSSDVPFLNGFLRFVPPEGALEFSMDGQSLGNSAVSSKLIFEIQYGLSDLPQYKRRIEYDLTNFNADVEEVS